MQYELHCVLDLLRVLCLWKKLSNNWRGLVHSILDNCIVLCRVYTFRTYQIKIDLAFYWLLLCSDTKGQDFENEVAVRVQLIENNDQWKLDQMSSNSHRDYYYDFVFRRSATWTQVGMSSGSDGDDVSFLWLIYQRRQQTTHFKSWLYYHNIWRLSFVLLFQC